MEFENSTHTDDKVSLSTRVESLVNPEISMKSNALSRELIMGRPMADSLFNSATDFTLLFLNDPVC